MFYDNKNTIWVFSPTIDNPMSVADLIVYSYISYKSRYDSGKKLNISRISWNTGLSRPTVTSVLDNLRDFGLLVNNEPQHNAEWFKSRSPSEKEKEPHFSQKYQYWKSLVRTEGSPLTVVDVMVFSYLLHRFLAKQFPKKWTCVYVANGLCCDSRTVSKSLERLEQHQLFQDNGQWCVPTDLVGNQCLWFRKKEQFSNSGEMSTFTPDFSEEGVQAVQEKAEEKAEAKEKAKPLSKAKKKMGSDVFHQLGFIKCDTEYVSLMDQVVSLPNWENEYEQMLEMLSPEMTKKEKRKLFSELITERKVAA